MKKLILLSLLFLSLQVEAKQLLVPPICEDYGWALIAARSQPTPHSYFEDFCILPNGRYYHSFYLDSNKEDDLKNLFDQYSGHYPSFEQIEKAREQILKEGYILN